MTALFPHQVEAYRELLLTAETFFSGNWKGCGLVAPRFNRLLIGPSGTGKTHLVRRLAEELNMPFMELSSTCWIPLGCSERGARPTWLDVAQFCTDNHRGIIFTDEVDKLGQSSPWMTFLKVELFLLYDKLFPANLRRSETILDFDDEDEDEPKPKEMSLAELGHRLRDGMFVVGGGAFQDLWSARSTTPIGFGDPAENTTPVVEHHDLAQMIPIEIANRFATPPIALSPLMIEDYNRLLLSLCESAPLNLRAAIHDLGKQSLRDAVRGNLGCRWGEQLVLQALMRVQQSDGRPRPSPVFQTDLI